jgi:hypothetical protein
LNQVKLIALIGFKQANIKPGTIALRDSNMFDMVGKAFSPQTKKA